MKYYDHYILAQGGIHDITAFAVAFNFKFFAGRSNWFHESSFLRLTHVVFPIAHGLHVFMSCFTLLVSRLHFHRSARAAHVGHRRWPSQFFTGDSFHLRDVRCSCIAFHGLSWAFNHSFAVHL